MFVFVFYFQGPEGDSAIVAGLKLIPLAVGMLIASPLAGAARGPAWLSRPGHGWHARERGRVGIDDHTRCRIAVLADRCLALRRRRRLGDVQLAEHRGDDGIGAAAASRRRGRRADLITNSGAVISIAFVLAIVTAAVPTHVLFAIFSGLASGLSAAQLAPFITNMHLALWILAGISLLGAGVCSLRPAHPRTGDSTLAARTA